MSDTNLNNQTEAGSTATPSWNEALSSTIREAVTEADGADEAGSVEADEADSGQEADAGDSPEGDADHDTENQPEGTEDAPDESGDEAWDGNPESLPGKFRDFVDKSVAEAVKKRESEMSRGVNKLLVERQEMVAYIQQLQAQHQAPPAQQQAGPPPTPGADASPEDWDRYYDKRTDWQVQQTIAQMVQSGALLTPQAIQPVQQHAYEAAVQAEQMGRLAFISRLPGCSDGIMQRMADLAQADPNLHALMSTDKGAETVFNIAKGQVEYETKLNGAGQKAQDNARRGAGAAGNAIPRPGGVRKQSDSQGRPKESFRSVGERIQYEIEQSRRD